MKRWLAVMLATLLSGCAAVYVPSSVNIPVLSEKGDVEIGGYVSTHGIGVQAATATTDHLGVIATFSASRNLFADEFDSGLHHERFDQGQLGVGSGYHYGGATMWRAGLFAGTGFGWSDVPHRQNGTGKATYWRPFAQGHVGATGNWAGASLALRASLVIRHFGPFLRAQLYVAQPFLEPAASLWLGPPALHLYGQAGLSVSLRFIDHFGTQRYLSVGLRLRLDEVY